MVEQRTENPCVTGSIPVDATKDRGAAINNIVAFFCINIILNLTLISHKMKTKKLLIICIAAITLVGTSCSSSKNNLNVTNLVNKAYSYISKINNLLSKIPTNCNILNIDSIKDNTVVTLNDVTGLLTQSTTIYNKYKDPSTRSSISLTDILNLVNSLQSTENSLATLKTQWNTASSQVKGLNKTKIQEASESLNFIKNGLDLGTSSITETITSLNSIISVLNGN